MKKFKLIYQTFLQTINSSKKGFLKQTLAFLLFITGMTFYTPIMTQKMIDVIYSENLGLILKTGVFAIVSIIAICMIQFYNNVHADMNSYRAMDNFCKNAVIDINKLPLQNFRKYEKGDIFERINSYTFAPILIIQQVFLLGSAVISLVIFSISITSDFGFLIVLAVASYVINFAITKKATDINTEIEAEKKQVDAVRYDKSYEFIDNLDFYISNDLCDEATVKILEEEAKSYKLNQNKNLVNAVKDGLIEISSNLQFVLLAVNCTYKFIAGLITASYVFAANTFLGSLKSVFNRLLNTISKAPEMVVPVERIVQIKEDTYSDVPMPKTENITDDIIVKLNNISMVVGDRKILSCINDTIYKGEKIALIGTNGSGKTTLLKSILGYTPYTSGNVELNQNYIASLTDIAYMPAEHLLYSETTLDNILMACSDDTQRTDICSEFVNQDTNSLSGGQKQRCNCARAINKQSALLIADEPTANLDSDTAHKVIKEIIDKSDTCIVTVHDMSLIPYFSRVIELHDGKIIN